MATPETGFLKKIGLFIAEKRFTKLELERLLNLVKRDSENLQGDLELYPELKAIENLIVMELSIDLKRGDGRDSKNVKSHSPLTMAKFLNRFSSDEKFKWFTHSPDGLDFLFNYSEYVKNGMSEYNDTTGWDVNNATFYNVRHFIFDKSDSSKPKSFENGEIQFSWKDLADWCANNPNVHPYNAIINGTSFQKYINQFKRTIEFRADDSSSAFNTTIRRLFRLQLGQDFKITFSSDFDSIGQSLRAYCDVNQFIFGVKKVCEWIVLNKVKSNVVRLSLIDNPKYYIFEIFHLNSYWTINQHNEKMKGLSGDFDTLRKTLFSVVDWEIFASLMCNGTVNNVRIICLNENVKMINNRLTVSNIVENIDYEISGVKHIFKIYK